MTIKTRGTRFFDYDDGLKKAKKEFGNSVEVLFNRIYGRLHHKSFNPATGEMTLQLVSPLDHRPGHIGGWKEYMDWVRTHIDDPKKLKDLNGEQLARLLQTINNERHYMESVARFKAKQISQFSKVLRGVLEERTAIELASKGTIVLRNSDGAIVQSIKLSTKGKRILGVILKESAEKGVFVLTFVVAVGSAAYTANAAGADLQTILQESARAGAIELSGGDLYKLAFELVFVNGSNVVAEKLIDPKGLVLKRFDALLGDSQHPDDLRFLQEQLRLIEHYLEKTIVDYENSH